MELLHTLLNGSPNRDSVRELTPEEIKSVEHVFTDTGNPLPDPTISTFIGAVENGKVVGFLVLQVKLHAEPMWIEEGHSDVFLPIIKQAEKTILGKAGPQYVYLFAPAGRVSQLAQSMGMQLEPWCVLSKLVQPDLPSKQPVDLLTAFDQVADHIDQTHKESADFLEERLM